MFLLAIHRVLFFCVSIAMPKWIKGEDFKRNVTKEKNIHRCNTFYIPYECNYGHDAFWYLNSLLYKSYY